MVDLLLNAELSRRGRPTRVDQEPKRWETGELYLTPHCYHQDDSTVVEVCFFSCVGDMGG